nr:hypothetical protein [uncultured Sphingomonas sp.]
MISQLANDEVASVGGGVQVIYVKVTRSDGSYYFYPMVVGDDYPSPISHT